MTPAALVLIWKFRIIETFFKHPWKASHNAFHLSQQPAAVVESLFFIVQTSDSQRPCHRAGGVIPGWILESGGHRTGSLPVHVKNHRQEGSKQNQRIEKKLIRCRSGIYAVSSQLPFALLCFCRSPISLLLLISSLLSFGISCSGIFASMVVKVIWYGTDLVKPKRARSLQ